MHSYTHAEREILSKLDTILGKLDRPLVVVKTCCRCQDTPTPTPLRHKTVSGSLSKGDEMSAVKYTYTVSPKSNDKVTQARVKLEVEGYQPFIYSPISWPSGAPAPTQVIVVPAGSNFTVTDADADASSNWSEYAPVLTTTGASDTTSPPAPGGGSLSTGDEADDSELPPLVAV